MSKGEAQQIPALLTPSSLISSFFAPTTPSLKICGVTSTSDASELVTLGVPAIGINFYPQSKRYCSPEAAAAFLPDLGGDILRVGVFVNNAPELAWDLLKDGLIDVVQLHGDEPPAELEELLAQGITVIRSLTLPKVSEVGETLHYFHQRHAEAPHRFALLLDAHAPGVYGGTGQTIDWDRARDFITAAGDLPVLLAGGITRDNAAEALAATHPAGIDIASGAESAPGRKDFAKVSALLKATLTYRAG